MTNTDLGKQPSRPDSDMPLPQDDGCESITDDVRTLVISNDCSRRQGQQLENEETCVPEDPPYPIPSSSCSKSDDEEIVIAAIRVTDIALGLRRLPVGFFIMLYHNAHEWRTDMKTSSVNYDVVEWSGPIPIISSGSDTSATIRLEVYASFGFQPMLGSGERLRKLTVTVRQLLDRSETGSPFTFFPKDGDIVSPCSSIFITVKQQTREKKRSSMLRVLGSHWSMSEPPGELEEATNRGHSALSRYQKYGSKQDLECSIRQFEHALNICPPGHHGRAPAQSNLAMAKLVLSQLEHIDVPLLNALWLYRSALAARPVGHPDRPSTLIQLAAVHLARFQRHRDYAEEASARTLLVEALGLGSIESHEHRAAMLMRQMQDGRNVDHVQPDEKFSVEHEAALRSMDNDLLKAGASFLERFGRFGDLADLQQAIGLLGELVRDTPIREIWYCFALMNLGVALSHRFERLGEFSDLEEAIGMFRDAVDLLPHGHLRKPGFLNNLGNTLRIRFQHLGHLADLEASISTYRNAIDLAPHGHFDRLGCLTNLGSSLRQRFLRLGQLSDLEDAISSLRQCLRDAADVIPNNHHLMPVTFTDLGISLLNRFEHLHQQSDLEDAISCQTHAVDLTLHDHPGRPARLSNLAIALTTRFECLGQLSDIDDAISRQRDAINLTPDGHSEKPASLNNLGMAFKARFERLGQPSDLDDAIQWLREAISRTPHRHPQRPFRLHNLGISLGMRFQRFCRLTDLEDAISRLMDTVDITPHGHYGKASYLGTLGFSLYARFRLLGELSNMELAISLFSHAASSPIGSLQDRFRASRRWISCARDIRHHTLLHAYSVAISLLPQLAWIGLPLQHRYNELALGADIVQEAAAAVLDAGHPQTAIEWLEQGRSIVWGELLRLRDPHDELLSVHPDYARRLRILSIRLEEASASHDKQSAHSTEPRGATHHIEASSRQLGDRHRALAIQRNKLLQEIRRLPGFEQFLRPKRFSQLRASIQTIAGPVVILNAVKSRCDALILVPKLDHAIHVPLPNFTLERSTNLQGTLKYLVRHGREGKCVPSDGVSWDHILSPLWKSVVKPVLDALAISVPFSGTLPRIFWCPTGPLAFLPIHAAGLYDRQYMGAGHKVFDFVVSSYVPTVSILSQPSNFYVPRRGDLRLLLVRQPPSDGLGQLPGVEIEMGRIKDLVRNSPSARTTVLEASDGTVEEVLAQMKKADWVHFACHGVQDGLDSGLCLAHGRRLKLRALTTLLRPKGGLAFLSACQTAKGEQKLAEEALHMAAGMLFAGYGGVVGTMWSISDRLAPDVSRDVYAQLLRQGTRPDYRDAARALHDAIGGLRERAVSFDEWIPFIHVGL